MQRLRGLHGSRFGMGFGAMAAVAALAFSAVGLSPQSARAAPMVPVASPSAGFHTTITKDTPKPMANDGRQRFQASLELVRNNYTGEAFLIPSDKELAEIVQTAEADFEQMLHARREGGETDAAQAKTKAEFKARQTADLARIKRDSDMARPFAEKLEYTLVRPLYREFQQYQNEATEFDYSMGGASNWNESKFRELLLKNGGVEQDGRVLSEQEIDRLDPLVAENLGARLARSLRPDSKRLSFTSAPLTRT